MDPATHKRYLDYRERHAYFGRKLELLTMTEFQVLDAEHSALAAKDPRDDDEETRYEELSALLLRD